jgi:hypothetical protein
MSYCILVNTLDTLTSWFGESGCEMSNLVEELELYGRLNTSRGGS